MKMKRNKKWLAYSTVYDDDYFLRNVDPFLKTELYIYILSINKYITTCFLIIAVINIFNHIIFFVP